MENSFMDSRFNFVSALSEQISVNTGEELYDKKGTFARAALLGISKQKISEALEKNKTYSQNKALLENSAEVTDPFEKAQLLLFKDFYQTVQALEDPESPVSLKEEVIALLSKYDNIEAAALEIENGSSPKEIFAALTQSEKWKSDARDFKTRDYVELPSKRQKEKWTEFHYLISLINDLKTFGQSYKYSYQLLG